MPQREYHFYVYILASRSRSLYVGFTNDIRLRIKQHREKRPGSHTANTTSAAWSITNTSHTS
jgi:putative endonuclease